MPGKSPPKDGRPADSRPCPPSFDPKSESPDKPTSNKKKRDIASIVKSSSAKVSPDKVAKPASMVPFRHRWMKKVNSKGIPFADLEVEVEGPSANTSKDGQKTPKSRSKGGDYSPGPAPPVGINNGLRPEKDEEGNYDSENGEMIDDAGGREETFMDEEGKIGVFVPRAMNSMEKSRKKLKTPGVKDPNGRQVGRKLVLWHRPRMIEKLVLHIQYECHKHGVKIPWDDVVHRLNPGSSGPSATQMLNKLRDQLVTEGHMIPPILGKATSKGDPTLRGYIRDMDSLYASTTKAVRWTDDVTDRKDNLSIPGLVRGSGKYRKIPKSEVVPVPIVKEEVKPGQRRNRVPAEVNQWNAEQRALKETLKKARSEQRQPKRVTRNVSGGTGSGRSPRVKKEDLLNDDSDSEVDPADLESDEDYNPDPKKKGGRRGKRVVSKVSTPDHFGSPTPRSRKRSAKVASGFTSDDDDEGEANTPNSLIVKFRLPSGGLKRFESGESGKKPENAKLFNPGPAKILFKDELMKRLLQDVITDGDAQTVVYLGLEMHGTMPQFMKAITEDTDPRANGLGFGGDAELMWKRCRERPEILNQLTPEECEVLHRNLPEVLPRAETMPADQMEVDDGADAVEEGDYDVEGSGNEQEHGAPLHVEYEAYAYGHPYYSSFSQQYSQSFTDNVVESASTGFSSQGLNLGDALSGNYDNSFAETSFQDNHGGYQVFDPFSTPSRNQGVQMDVSPFLQSGGSIFEDHHHQMSNGYTNGWVPERSESPALHNRFATRLYDCDDNNENILDTSAYLETSDVEVDLDTEEYDGFQGY